MAYVFALQKETLHRERPPEWSYKIKLKKIASSSPGKQKLRESYVCTKEVKLNTDLNSRTAGGKKAHVNTLLTHLDYVLKDFINHIAIAHGFPVSVAGWNQFSSKFKIIWYNSYKSRH